MTATLTFTLPEEADAHRLAVAAPELAAIVAEADQQLRTWIKHGHQFTSTYDALIAARALLLEAHPIIHL